MLSRLKFKLNAVLIEHSWLLDFGYKAGYYLFWVEDAVRNFLATARPVAPSELERVKPNFANACVRVDVTTVCNARCTFCAYPKVIDNKTLKPGTMKLDLFRKVVGEWGQHRGHALDLTPLVGDPLVDPGLFAKVEFAAREAKIPVILMNTNGILLNRNENYRKMIDCGVTNLAISTQGTDRAEFMRVYGVDKYDLVMDGLHKLLEYNREKGEPVSIRIRFRNAQKPSAIIRSADFNRYIRPYLSRRVQVSFTVRYDTWAGTISEEDLSGEMMLRKELAPINVPCANLFSLTVMPDGNARLCGCQLKHSDVDGLVIGNVAEASLLELSEGPRFQKIVQGFYRGERPEVCVGCTAYRPVTRGWLNHYRAAGDGESRSPGSDPVDSDSVSGTPREHAAQPASSQ